MNIETKEFRKNLNYFGSLINLLVVSKSEEDFKLKKEKYLENSFTNIKEDFSYNDMLEIIGSLKEYNFLINKFNVNQEMSLFFIKNILNYNEKKFLELSRYYYLEEESIEFLISKEYFNNYNKAYSLFSKVTTDKKYDYSHSQREEYKKLYFKKIINNYGTEIVKLLNNEDKIKLSNNLFNIKHISTLNKLPELFKDIKVSKEYIESQIFKLYQDKPKKSYSNLFEIYFNNIDKNTIIEILNKPKDEDLNHFITPYLIENNIIGSLEEKNILELFSKISSSEKIKILKKSSNEEREKFINYIFNDIYFSNIDFSDLHSKYKSIFKNENFLNKSKNEMINYINNNFYNIVVNEFIIYNSDKEINNNKYKENNKTKHFLTILEIICSKNELDKEILLKKIFNDFYHKNAAIKQIELLDKNYNLLKDCISTILKIDKDDLTAQKYILPYLSKSHLNQVYFLYMEKEVLERNLNKVHIKNPNKSKRL